ncbi:5-formyltetrahydrofolate cyclo-ligase, partial [Chelativorans sp. M5D2P16]|uniref:5-formyltetrahydrofolate cyclo-ligase n=1 Tax=Chelativorans sp. M5D2P16 TaxID=3095678 RepID=UPI002ACAC2DB|nr:5-formyltetrahydrofolate cyclo-ligase [Chelativorans sp. M5D2P16]
MIGDEDDHPPRYASSPCFMHEVDPHYMGMAGVVDPRQHADVMRWRKAERERLIKARLSMPSDVRREHGLRIAAQLEEAIGNAAGLTVSIYWPFRGEPDLRALVEHIARHGG